MSTSNARQSRIPGVRRHGRRRSTRRLSPAGRRCRVRAVVRDTAAAELPGGVEVVRGDVAEPAGLDVALAGVD